MRAHLVACTAVITCVFASSALAQQPAPPSGPLVLEPVPHGFVVAPDVKLTEMNHRFSTLVGGYGVWVLDDQLFMGGAGYGLAYQKGDHPGMGYGGFVIGWNFDPHRPISISAKGLLGAGGTSQRFGSAPICSRPGYVCATSIDFYYPYGYHSHTAFLVAEPEVDVVARLGTHARFTAGFGYRATDEPHGVNLHTGGATGSFSVQVLLGK